MPNEVAQYLAWAGIALLSYHLWELVFAAWHYLRRRRGREQERALGVACMKCFQPLPWDSAFAICRPCRDILAVTQPQSSPATPGPTPRQSASPGASPDGEQTS